MRTREKAPDFNKAFVKIALLWMGIFLISNADAANMADSARLNLWYNQSKVGLMIHWGMGTSPKYATPAAFEAAASSWTPSKWVNDAKRIHAGYISLATFHTSHHHLLVWNSDVPGTPRTKRNFLQELTTEAHKAGIKVVVYITTNLYNAVGDTLFDIPGYKAYAKKLNPVLTDAQLNSSFDISNNLGFGAYTYDVTEELYKKYGVDGFWFDAINNVTWYADYPWAKVRSGNRPYFPYVNPNNILYDSAYFVKNYFYHRDMNSFVHNLNDSLITFVNNFTPIMSADVIGKEHGSEPTVFKLGSVSGSLVYGREELLIPAGDWWYNGTAGTVNIPLQIKKIVHCIGTGHTATVSEGPKVNGDFPPTIVAYNDSLEKFFAWAAPALFDVVPGGHGLGGYAAGTWNSPAYGVTTFNPKTKTHYIHVLTAPSTNTLTLNDSGYSVKQVNDLKTSLRLGFTQSAGKLNITVPNWNSVATDGVYIIKVTLDVSTPISHKIKAHVPNPDAERLYDLRGRKITDLSKPSTQRIVKKNILMHK